jgi:uncharacterized protein
MAGPSILIAALSGRAAANSARRAGFAPLVADLFGDDDMRAAAAASRRVAGDLATGFSDDSLIAALSNMAKVASKPPVGFVYGAGFEDRPGLLAQIADRWPLIGNMPETVAAVKDPWRLAETLGELDIAHPEIGTQARFTPGWLLKRRGGAGGTHINKAGVGTYAQRRVEGRSVSVLFLAGRSGVDVVGFSDQWTEPTPSQPFRFGGASAPADIDEELAEDLGKAVRKVAHGFSLKGLNSADFIVGRAGWWLIEINPRLGATLDLFDNHGELFTAHIAAVRGEPPPPLEQPPGGRAIQLLYTPAAISSMPRMNWPDWIADRPSPGEVVPAQTPLCTILANAKTPAEARRLCELRAEDVLKNWVNVDGQHAKS